MTELRGRPSWSFSAVLTASLLMLGQLTNAYQLDPNSTDSVKNVARQITEDLMSFYTGDQPGGTPGLLPEPYYWWEAGAMMGAMVDYWYYTGDSTWNAVVEQALLFQVGENNDYMTKNQTLTEGNDDQGFWALAVMSAAEHNFPDPPPDKPQWLAIAQGVFNTQAARWDTEHCNGGLRWQIFQWNKGYDYKNSISQACFFSLAARLALYTGNTSYSDWAETTWQWMVDIHFIDDSYYVYDGASIGTGCTDIVPYQFSYNAGGMILGASAMYNYTGSEIWKNRLDGLLKGADVFFVGNNSDIMQEVACEPVDLCNIDQQSFKAYLTRWLASMTKWAPHTLPVIMPKLRASSVAAAAQCTGGENGRMCGLKWTDNGVWDGSTGVGQQMAAMEIVLSNMIEDSPVAVTAETGGTSVGDPSAGGDDIGRTDPKGPDYKPIGPGDTAGAVILTVIVLVGLVAGAIWMMMDETQDKSVSERWDDFRSAVIGGGATAALVRKRNKKGPVLGEKGKGADNASSTASSLRTSSGRVGVLSGLPMHTGDVKTRSSMTQKPYVPHMWQRTERRAVPEEMSGARGTAREQRLRKSQNSVSSKRISERIA